MSCIDHRLTYKYWINYSYEYYPKDIKILTNSDIYLLYNIEIFNSCIFDENKLYVLTRKDETPEGNIVTSKETYDKMSTEINAIYSQDGWIFKNKLNNIDNIETNFFLGYENCDRLFKNSLIFHGIEVINFFPAIFCVHKDYRTTKKRKKYNL
jgi:hypothetical protein